MEALHRAVQVSPLWIGPPWEDAPEVEPVVIDPGRAFGTGAHPTTRLCIEMLLGIERGSVLDVGCGSGVLAIAARKLGFGPVTAIDVDEAAVEAAARNAQANGVEVDVRLLAAASERAACCGDRRCEHRPADPRQACSSAEADCARHVRLLRSRPSDRPGIRSPVRKTDAGWAADLFGRQ